MRPTIEDHGVASAIGVSYEAGDDYPIASVPVRWVWMPTKVDEPTHGVARIEVQMVWCDEVERPSDRAVVARLRFVPVCGQSPRTERLRGLLVALHPQLLDAPTLVVLHP